MDPPHSPPEPNFNEINREVSEIKHDDGLADKNSVTPSTSCTLRRKMHAELLMKRVGASSYGEYGNVILWDVTTTSTLSVEPDNGYIASLQNVHPFYQTTRCHIPEDITFPRSDY
jgi:hypothetical protein